MVITWDLLRQTPRPIDETDIPVWLRNRMISAGLEPVPSYTEKLCITLYLKKIATNIFKNHKINTSFVNPGLKIYFFLF